MKIKALFLIIFLVVSSQIASAQTQVQPPIRPYNVLSYNLLMDWRNVFNNGTQVFSGHNQIQVVNTEATSEIVLDASEMTIDSVNVDGLPVFIPGILGDTVDIPLTPAESAIGSQITLDVYYTHTIDTIDPESGMFFYPKGTPSEFSSGTIPEDLAYTMSEPDGARKWMPCNDEPYDKANSAISVIVPSGYSAQSNGILQSIDTNSKDNSLTFYWQSDRPMSTYLMTAYASKWMTWRDYYHRLSDPNDSVPVIYYAWQPDYDAPDTTGGRLPAHFAFRNTPKMLEYDSKMFGEYPFTQYSQIPLDPFYFGGMEHQTITALDRGILDGTQETTIAHELFHQWFGDKTTCETWADIWLNEGFATYGEMLWTENSSGEDAYDNYARAVAGSFLDAQLMAPTYNPPEDLMFNWPYVNVVYYKPGCVLYMLRRMLNNDTLFFHTIRDYSAQFAYTTANTFQFRDFIANRDSALAPMDLKTFINQWIFQPDWPIYHIRWATNGDSLAIQVDQVQDSTDHYTMPLRFKAINQNDTITLVFLNNARSQTFTALLPNTIQRLEFDTLSVIDSKVTILHDQNLTVNSGVSPEHSLMAVSSNGAMKLTYPSIVSGNVMLRVADVLGRTIVEYPLAVGSLVTTLTTTAFTNGDYFATLTDGKTRQTVKFHFEK